MDHFQTQYLVCYVYFNAISFSPELLLDVLDIHFNQIILAATIICIWYLIFDLEHIVFLEFSDKFNYSLFYKQILPEARNSNSRHDIAGVNKI